ncbi:Os06g0567666 [Oryza sativa Japonica Group]|uniref:Os06g0567666 protein n=1 Tax=Oryza sativa subsp. japonica TaxID=39947 RepID=A0A0P0WYG8_ORYSJ|nr:hypothetical protein EE612_034880 [Oryza sativa]BAS98292.1 Os06g0567666 [Oryza sativa Japonica Group]
MHTLVSLVYSFVCIYLGGTNPIHSCCACSRSILFTYYLYWIFAFELACEYTCGVNEYLTNIYISFICNQLVIKWRMTTDLLGLMFSYELCKGIGPTVMRIMDDTMG